MLYITIEIIIGNIDSPEIITFRRIEILKIRPVLFRETFLFINFHSYSYVIKIHLSKNHDDQNKIVKQRKFIVKCL